MKNILLDLSRAKIIYYGTIFPLLDTSRIFINPCERTISCSVDFLKIEEKYPFLPKNVLKA